MEKTLSGDEIKSLLRDEFKNLYRNVVTHPVIEKKYFSATEVYSVFNIHKDTFRDIAIKHKLIVDPSKLKRTKNTKTLYHAKETTEVLIEYGYPKLKKAVIPVTA